MKRRAGTKRNWLGQEVENCEEEEKADSAFDAQGVLKDGRSARVSLMMRDSLSDVQKATLVHQPLVIDTDTPMQVVDAYGGTEGLNRPDARYLVAGHRSTDHAKLVTAAAMRDEAYRQRELEDGERWRGGETPQPATDAGDVDPRQAAYDAYDREMAEAWRKGR